MPHETTSSADPADTNPSAAEPLAGGTRPPPGLGEIFFGFLSIAIVAFGGVLPIARRAVVERYRWITSEEFTELVGLAQFLPGPNIVNFSVVLGGRFRGPAGAVAAFLGLTAVPMIIVIGLSWVFTRYAEIGAVANVLSGLAAAAAGLVIAMAGRMAAPIWRHPTVRGVAVVLVAFVAIALFGLSLPMVMLALAPVSVALAWRALP